MQKYVLAMLMALVLAAPVGAGEILRGYFTGLRDNESYVVSVKDADTAKIDLFLDNNDHVGHYILKDGTLWHLALYSAKFDWQVTDYAEIVADLKGGADPVNVDISFTNTRRTAEQAGYTCQVYQITDNVTGETYEAWLNINQDVLAVSRVLMMLFGDPRAEKGGRNVLEYINGRQNAILGMVRFDDTFKLQKIERVAVADNFFDLPGKTAAE